MKKLSKTERLVIAKRILVEIKETKQALLDQFYDNCQIEIDQIVETILDDISKLSEESESYLNSRAGHNYNKGQIFDIKIINSYAKSEVFKLYQFKELKIPSISEIDDVLVFAQIECQDLNELMNKLREQFC